MIKKILNILAERIYLITNELNVEDELKELIWVAIKFIIFRGEAFNNTKPLITDVHMDKIIISTTFYVLNLNKHNLELSKVFQIFKESVLFPGGFNLQDLEKVFNQKIK